jgi:hypothetical protein
MKSEADIFSLANIYGFSNMTTNSTASTWIMDGEIVKVFYFLFDLGYTMLIIWCIFSLKVYSKIINKSIEKKMHYTKTYALELRGVPYENINDYATEEDIIAHFEEIFGKIHEVSFIRNYGSMFDKFIEAAKLARRLELEEEKATLLISTGKKASERAVINLRK